MPQEQESLMKKDELGISVLKWSHCSVLVMRSHQQAAENILAGKSVLLVDDEPDVLESLEEILSMCRIETASDYNSAAALLKKNKYDVVVLDIMGVNGFALLEICVKLGFPAIMLTAHAVTADAIKKSMELGAVFFLPKEAMVELPEFMEKIVLGGGNPLWNSLFERLDFYLEKRLGKAFEEIKQCVMELESTT